MRITCWTNASCASLTTCFPVYVEDAVTARTSVIGILEVVHKQWDQAASKQQSVRQKSRITLTFECLEKRAIVGWFGID